MKTKIGIERRIKGGFQNVMDRTISALKAERTKTHRSFGVEGTHHA